MYYVCEGCVDNVTSCDEYEIVAGCDVGKAWAQGFAQESFGAIADDGAAEFFGGDEGGARLVKSIGSEPQYDERVGKCASFLPHPLYVGFCFETPRAFHALLDRDLTGWGNR